MVNFLIDNNYVFYGLCSVSICLITGYFIKSYFYSTVIETPNSPQTFNFTNNQLNEIQDLLEQGEDLDPQIQEQLNQDFQNILGEENFANFQQDVQDLETELVQQLQDIFNNLI